MRALLDTHAILWSLSDDPRLGPEARTWVASSQAQDLAVSDISLLELSMLIEKKRVVVSEPVDVFLASVSDSFNVLSIDAYIAAKAMEIELPQGDPFDRVIAATAHRHQLPLITRDRRLTELQLVSTVW